MISASMSEGFLRSVFEDPGSPFAAGGFVLSLHGSASESDGSTEIASATYARAVYGHGASYWAIGARVAMNRLEIVFPRTDDGEVWPAARSVGIRSADTGQFVWSVAFDAGQHAVGNGGRLVIPSGGLVVSIG